VKRKPRTTEQTLEKVWRNTYPRPFGAGATFELWLANRCPTFLDVTDDEREIIAAYLAESERPRNKKLTPKTKETV